MDDILIVEDDRALSQGIRLGLEGEGRRFIQTSTLDQGERALEERPFSLVVLDLNLPDGSGLELLRRLRARSAPVSYTHLDVYKRQATWSSARIWPMRTA